MKINELLEKLNKIKNKKGGEIDVQIRGIYSSVGEIEDVYFYENRNVVVIESDIQSG